MPEIRKREIAHKLKIGDLLKSNQIFEESESLNKFLRFVELNDKKIQRVNIIANVVDKFESEGETKFASITLDDGSGQIRVRVFGEDVSKFKEITQGDTLLIIGFLRSYNQELYIFPEIIKKQNPKYLVVRKIEIENSISKEIPKEKSNETKDPEKPEPKNNRNEIINLIKNAEKDEGIDIEEIITKLNEKPETINQEIKKLLEEGVIYEPRPGRVRYLG